jgi:hypothetical protein
MAERNDAVRRGSGISRRELLRRGAIVGGTVAWATPLIQSLTPPAYAQMGPSPGGNGCCYCFNGPAPGPGDDGECHNDGTTGQRENRDACENFCRDSGFDNSQYLSGPGNCTCVVEQGCTECV